MSEVPKSKFGPVSAILVTLLAFFGSQLLAGLLIGGILSLTGKTTHQAITSLTDSTFGRFMFVLIVEALTIAILFWFMRRRKITLGEIGLGRAPKFGDIGWAFMSFIGYFLLTAIAMYLVGQYVHGVNLDQKQELGFDQVQGAPQLFLVFASLVILPPLVEETMIRGFLYSGLRRKFGKMAAAVLASIVFGLAHLQLGEGAPPLYVAGLDTFILSMVLIYVREKTGSLWAGMLVHALKNGLAFAALFVFHSG